MIEVNEYGIPLHACNGYRHDEHYWTYLKHLIKTSQQPLYVWIRKHILEGKDD